MWKIYQNLSKNLSKIYQVYVRPSNQTLKNITAYGTDGPKLNILEIKIWTKISRGSKIPSFIFIPTN